MHITVLVIIGCSNSSSYRTVNERNSIIRDDRDCNYEFTKIEGYCQLKIEDMNIYTAPKDGICEDGSMTVKESATVTGFPLCGTTKRPSKF